MLNVIGRGVDNAGDQYFVVRERPITPYRPFESMARVAGAIEVIEIVGAVSAVTCRGTPLGGRRIQGLTLDEAALRDVRDKSSR